jgi:hypothetical protein
MKSHLPLFILFNLCCTFHSFAQPTITFNPIATGFLQPLEIKNAGDGSKRLFIAQQGGLIRIYKNGVVQPSPFLDISKLVGVGQFNGLWSIAFSPNFVNDQTFFVLYTDRNFNTALVRYKVSKTNPDSADKNSAVTILNYPQSGGGHFGNLAFGNDQYLYISLGAGGNNRFSQNGKIDFGKMLRINIKVKNPPYYSIPPDNPFLNDTSMLPEIWATGLRNAWRWSFDKPNGDMWIADVGQDSIEEVDYRTTAQGLLGSNFGWDCYEGTQFFRKADCSNQNSYVFPIFEYHHDIPTGGECLIGGYVYRGSAYPFLQGYYICADFISAHLWEIVSNGSGGWNVYEQLTKVPKGITSFGVDEDGELYAVSNGTKTLYHLQATPLSPQQKINSIAANKNAAPSSEKANAMR